MSQEIRAREMDVAMGLGAPENPIQVSVILPAYNEEDSIDGIYRQVVDTFEPFNWPFEIIFVDDGSTDATWERIEAVSAADERVKAIQHRRNAGKATAIANAFSYARGETMITSDADMQYDPNDMVRLIEKLREGYDVVSAYKVLRRDPLSKRIPSKIFNLWVRNTTGVELHDFNAGLKAYRFEAAEDLIRYGYGDLHRFFILIAARRGFRVAEVPVESCYRVTGRSKYGIERYMRGALDYITVFFLSGYSDRPMHLLGSFGVWLLALGTLAMAAMLVATALSIEVFARGVILGTAGLAIITGLQLLVSGLIAEMINNLERRDAGRRRISQVVRVDRRTSIVLAPGVHVERRGGDAEPDTAPAPAQVERRAARR